MNRKTLSRRITSFTIIVFTAILLFSQTALSQVNLDSLRNVWNDPNQPDNTRLKAIQKIVWDGYLFSQPDSAFYFAQLQYDFAKSKGLKKQMANALYLQGMSFLIQSDYASAIDYYTRCLKIYEEIGDKMGIANASNSIGNIYFDQGDYTSAIDYYTRCLKIYEDNGSKKGIAVSLNNIGGTYKVQGEIASAIEYYIRSLTIKEEIGDKKGIASSLNNLGVIYTEQGDYTSAIDYFTRSLTTFEEIGDKVKFASSLNSLGITYMEQGSNAKAIKYSTRALTIAQDIGAVIEIRDASNALYKAYKSIGKNKQALEMYELYITTRDSIDSEKNQKEVIRQKYKYDYDKKAIADSMAYVQVQVVQEAKLEKSRILQYALIGGLTLLLVFLGYVFNRYRVTRKQQLIISEQNKELAIATEIAKTANTDLKSKSDELEKFNNTMLDREMRIIELKKEANKLAKTNNTDIPYPEVEDV